MREGSDADIEKGEVADTGKVEEYWKKTFNAQLDAAKSPLPASCCIFRVPEVLKRQNRVAYEPDIVSIGPFHRGRHEKFQLFENVKKWYLKCVLCRLEMSLDTLIKNIKGLEDRARSCYSEVSISDPNDFVVMLILDGCFLIELFRKAPLESRQDADDLIFNLSCMLEYLYHDLLLLENQLPWFVLEFFYELIERDSCKEPLHDVVIKFFKQSVEKPKFGILHILDLIRTALVQSSVIMKPPTLEYNRSLTRVLPQRIPNASVLSEAGVTFKKGSSSCLLDIEFKNGVFTIPSLVIDEATNPLFRNLMAYEQCYHSCMHRITSYAFIMDNLIDSSKDVDLLCEKGIVSNWLSAEAASKQFNDLYNDTTLYFFHYESLCVKVHEYHKAPWNRYREKLKRDYFDTPWSTVSFFAAFVLLVFTLLQTIYTIQTYYHPPS